MNARLKLGGSTLPVRCPKPYFPFSTHDVTNSFELESKVCPSFIGHCDNYVKSPRTNAMSIINSFANHGKSRKRHAADTSAIVQLEIDRDSDVERSDEEEKM